MIVALEGIPGAGKTTIAKQIVKKFNCVLVPELADFVGVKNFPKLSKTKAGIEQNEEWFKKMELKRYSEIKNKKRHLVYDRCYLSNLAFSYAYSKRMRINTFDNLRKEYAYLLSKKLLPQINVLIILKVPATLAINRLKKRHNMDAIWFDREFLNHLEYFYRNVRNLYAGEVHLIDACGQDRVTLKNIYEVLPFGKYR